MRSTPYRPYRFVIAGFLLLFNTSYGINFGAVAPIIPLIMDDYDVGRGTAGLLISVVIISQAVMFIPGGILAARSPVKLIFGLGWLMSGAMVLTVLVDSFPFLVALRAIYGLALALVMPTTARLVMRWFKPNETPIVTSLNVTSFTLGLGAGTFIAAPISLELGWQNTLSLFGGVLVVGGLAWALLAKIPPAEGATVSVVSFKDMWNLMRSKITLLLGLGDGVVLAQFFALTTWLPTYYNQEFDMSLTKAGFIVGLIPIVGFFATLVGGFLGSRAVPRRPLFIGSGLLAGLAGFGSFALNNEPLIYASMVALGISSFLYLPVLLTMPMELKETSEGNVAVTWAVMFAVSSAFGVVSPITVGFMTDGLDSYIPGFALWTVVALGIVVVGFLLPETGRWARRGAQPGLDQGA